MKTLEALGATFDFIDIWLKLLRKNYDSRCEAYINAMKDMFMQIRHNVETALTIKQKSKTHDRYWWWMVYGKKC